jgi:hypothetical protein
MRRTALVALVLAALAALGVAGAPALRGWVAVLFPADRYPLLFALFFVSWLAADRAPDGARGRVLLGGAAVQGLAFDPALFAVMAAWVLLYHRVLFARAHGAFKVGFLVATVLAWAVLCDARDVPGRDPFFMRGGYLFATGFFLQALRALVDARASDWRPVPRVELLVYFLIAPFWIVVPYMMAILPLDTARRGIAARDARPSPTASARWPSRPPPPPRCSPSPPGSSTRAPSMSTPCAAATSSPSCPPVSSITRSSRSRACSAPPASCSGSSACSASRPPPSSIARSPPSR